MRKFVSGLLAMALGVVTVACAAPIRRTAPLTPPSPAGAAITGAAPRYAAARPVIGVAFGGGSARGIAHVGVIRWFEEHRIPIDLVAGTSMGGLIGGSFASGMDADELDAMLAAIDWDEMFGSSNFSHKNIRRKSDARAFPSGLEFGVKRGLVAPNALNNGGQVEVLLRGIAAPYGALASFDALPTPFRAVAVDIVTATEVVLDRGSLAQAMRATMSLPLIFPPVEIDGRVLVDGGAMNNVPADIVKAMGADKVVAINVGDLTDPKGISYTLLGLAGATLDAMMRASTKRAIASADIVLDVPLEGFGSLDWRRSAGLVKAGYEAAEASREALLPLAVSEREYQQWQDDRASRRRRALPQPAFVRVEGFAASDTRRLNALLPRHVGVPLDVPALERDLARMTALDRYQTVTWRLATEPEGVTGLVVTGEAKPYAPPFMMLGLNLENTTSSDFQATASARYLGYGLLSSGSELRVDGTLGSHPTGGVELYEPIGPTPLFIAPYAAVTADSASNSTADRVLARYAISTARAGLRIGLNLGNRSDLRVGAYIGRVDANIEVGDLTLPELRGKESGVAAVWRFDGQDSPVVPSSGTAATVSWLRVLDGPDFVVNGQTIAADARVTQLSATMTRFWSAGERNRLFVVGGAGTSRSGRPLPTNEFSLGSPFRLGAYRSGELRGGHYYVGTAGYLRRLGRLPDFLGGHSYLGGWFEAGDAVRDWDQATWRTAASAGLILDTLIGPVMLAGSAGRDGRWRTYIGVGRIFR